MHHLLVVHDARHNFVGSNRVYKFMQLNLCYHIYKNLKNVDPQRDTSSILNPSTKPTLTQNPKNGEVLHHLAPPRHSSCGRTCLVLMGGGGAKIAAPPAEPAPIVAVPPGRAEAAAAAAIIAPNPASGAPTSPSPTTTGAPALTTPVTAGIPLPPFLATTAASAGDRGGVLFGVLFLGSPPAGLPAAATAATGVVVPPLPTDNRGDGDPETTPPWFATGVVRGVVLPGRAGVAAAVAVPGAEAGGPPPLTGVRPSTGVLPSTGVFFAEPPAPPFPLALSFPAAALSLPPLSFPSPTNCVAHAEASAQAGDMEDRRRRRSFLADRASHSARASAALGEKLRVPLPADTVDPGKGAR